MLGMTNPGYQQIDDYQDVESHNIFAIKQALGWMTRRFWRF